MSASGTAPGAGFDELATILREMAQRFGDSAFTDRRRLVSLLQDRMPDARRDIRAVAAALDERVFDSLARCRPEGLAMEMERLAANLENGLGLRPDVAVPVVQACAYALGLGPLPSVAGHPGIVPPVAGAGDGWVGVSEPVRAGPAGWVGVSEPVAAAAGPAAGPVVAPGAAPGVAPGVAPGTARGSSRVRKLAIGGVLAVVVVVGLLSTVRIQDDPPSPPQPAPQPVPQPAPQPVPQQGPQPVPQQGPQQFFAGEDQDFGVAPQSTLKQDVGTPTPTAAPGVRTVYTNQVAAELRQNHGMVLVDSLENSHPETIQGAVYLPASGKYGTFGDPAQAQLVQDLERLTRGQKQMPLVFFCQGPRCWESYNAALRARAAGYPNVFWFRGGLQAWAAAGLPMQPLGR